MQEDVLRLILLALSKGELIARKTLVMYIVQILSKDYPQVSKVRTLYCLLEKNFFRLVSDTLFNWRIELVVLL